MPSRWLEASEGERFARTACVTQMCRCGPDWSRGGSRGVYWPRAMQSIRMRPRNPLVFGVSGKNPPPWLAVCSSVTLTLFCKALIFVRSGTMCRNKQWWGATALVVGVMVGGSEPATAQGFRFLPNRPFVHNPNFLFNPGLAQAQF